MADPHGPFNKAPVTSVNDLNHDGLVNANDAINARNNSGNNSSERMMTAAAPGLHP